MCDESRDDDVPLVPVGVIQGIKALEEGRTLSGEELDEVLKF